MLLCMWLLENLFIKLRGKIDNLPSIEELEVYPRQVEDAIQEALAFVQQLHERVDTYSLQSWNESLRQLRMPPTYSYIR